MLDFKFKAESSRLRSGIETLAEGASDWREAWPKMTGQLSQIVSEVFESQGGRGGRGAWAPLSEPYARRKERRYPGQPLLQATRRLWRSLVGRSEDSVEEQSPRSLRLGTRVEYAPYLQSGTRRGLPARVIVDLSSQDQSSVAGAMQRQALRVVARAGFAMAGEEGRTVSAIEARRIGVGILNAGGPLSGGI